MGWSGHDLEISGSFFNPWKSLAQSKTRWWFQTFFIFTPIWGRFPFWLIFFRWVETTNQKTICRAEKGLTVWRNPQGCTSFRLAGKFHRQHEQVHLVGWFEDPGIPIFFPKHVLGPYWACTRLGHFFLLMWYATPDFVGLPPKLVALDPWDSFEVFSCHRWCSHPPQEWFCGCRRNC